MAINKRTAREIKISDKLLGNKKINVKVGTVENREAPETIYIFTSFWLEPTNKYKKEEQKHLKNILDKELTKIYSQHLKKELVNNRYFPREKENIFIKNIPENLNYNNKKNYISVELYLHTCNINSMNKLPISVNKNTELYDEAVRLSRLIGEADIFNNSEYFKVYKKSN
ncbi:MAG: hypothetical protein KatS3mg035_1133 [Bacteroidia bacterium]|nr:MAG: hypothetical protein KatS3mg035_1133 [Bacteroidia bacterium]